MTLLTHRVISAAALLALLPLAAGCWSTISSNRQAIELPENTFRQAAAATQGKPLDAYQEKWWLHFNDPQLNELIDRAALDNLTLQQAWYRLRQAREQAIQAGSGRWPSLDAGGSAGKRTTGIGTTSQTTVSTFGLNLAASYEIDLWGRVAATTRAAELNAMAQEQDLRTQGLSISAQIASSWYELCSLNGELALLDEQIKTNSEQLELTSLQFKRGLAERADVLQQQQLLEASRGERISTLSDFNVTKNTLAFLVGCDPGNFTLGEIPASLPEIPDQPQTGLPAELIAGRPDVQQALLEVRQADQSLAAAIANRFPKLSISASLGSDTNRVSDLFENWIASLATNLAAPVIDGGRLRSVVRQQRAAADESLAAYRQTILDAIREVYEALVKENAQHKYMISLDEQLALSGQSLDQIRESYRKGASDFSRLLTAQLSHQKLQRTHLTQRRTLLTNRINLCRALAGGWTPPQPDSQAARVTGPVAGLLDGKSE